MSSIQVDNARALSTLLSQLGGGMSQQRLLELGQGSLPLRLVAALLSAQGQTARPVRVGADDLARLETPTLLVLKSGEFCLLESVGHGRATVRRHDGALSSLGLEALALDVQTAIEHAPSVSFGRSFARGLLLAFAQCRSMLLWLFLVTLATAALGILLPWLARQAMGPALQDQAASLLVTVVAAMVAASCMQAWLGWLRARTRIALDVRLVGSTQHALFRRLLDLPYAEHQQRGLGQLLRAVMSAEAAARIVSSVGVGPVFDALASLAYIVVLAVTAPWMAVALIVAAALAAAAALVLSRRYARLQARELDASARSQARLHELLQGIATVKAGHAEGHGLLRWLSALVTERGFGLGRDLTQAWLALVLTTIQRGGGAAILIWTAFEALDARLEVVDLVYIGMLATGFLHSATTLCQSLIPLSGVSVHLTRLDELLATEPTPPKVLGEGRAKAKGPTIELSDVWFRYGPDQPWILKGYDLTLEEGEQLELHGPSGMGKTTILRLIAGLYRPERGTVSVLGRDPWRNRGHVTYLPQHAQLLSGSLRDNLEQLSGASLERVVQACRATGLVQWLQTLPMGLETVVAPGGSNLSGGQRQWVVLTAAAAATRPILLLDEAMSQMDRVVRGALSKSPLWSGKTVVSVSHDH
jgi:ABC-type bacteriocin/lantibiotic exporter with double-glycine peptidase domain